MFWSDREDNRIAGIVTSSDLGNQFMELAGPFLILGEIEMHLRRLVLKGFTLQELQEPHPLVPMDIQLKVPRI